MAKNAVSQSENHDESQASPSHRRSARIVITPARLILFLLINLIILLFLAWPQFEERFNLSVNYPWNTTELNYPTEAAGKTGTPLPDTSTPTLTTTPTPSATLPVFTPDTNLWEQGIIILALEVGSDTHLYAYQPLVKNLGPSLPLTRLTTGPWDDIAPAISPDGTRLAFVSNRNGQWDIYMLDLKSGRVEPFTVTPEFESAPSWSPDGKWITFERYVDENLEIMIQPVDGGQDPIRLTNHLAADSAPTWSPSGRQIAFVSTRSGRNHIWIADLDQSAEKRFIQISLSDETTAKHPTWSPDGRYLAWSAVKEDGLHKIFFWDSVEPQLSPRESGSGDWPLWSPDGQTMLAILLTPHQTYLNAFPVGQPDVLITPLLPLPGSVKGIVWEDIPISGEIASTNDITPTPLWLPALTVAPGAPGGRQGVVPLVDVDAPYSQLHDMVDESFVAFRNRLATEIGWDLLATLENAYVPLTSALAPGMRGDWLYTGRAIAVNTAPINAGWMVVVREDFAQQTFWRVFLRARFQDGSQGMPLHQLPWDFDARYRGEPLPYEQGGEVAQAVPLGYWVDMTALAAAYGWERLAALSTWRAAYPAARFNEFVMTDGLDWKTAMLEIYPPEALLTPTPVPTPTLTLTRTPRWYRSPTPTITDTPTSTGTPTRIVPTVP
jgi:TolB protein